MSEKIKWANLADKDKIALVIKHVMGYDVGDNGVTFFDPLHNWNDVWTVLIKMTEWFALRRGEPLLFGPHEDAMEFLLNGHSLWTEIDPVSDLFDIVRTWTPERICIATLKATGLEIEADERN